MSTQYRIYLQNPNDGQWYPFGPPFTYMASAEMWIRKSSLSPCDYIVKPVLEGEAPFVGCWPVFGKTGHPTPENQPPTPADKGVLR